MQDRPSSVQVDDAWSAIEHFLQGDLTDGLPVVPPTEELVNRFLDHVGLEPEHVVGAVPARDLVITARTVAVNAVMAGCLPQYLPVITAVVEAICDEGFNIHGASVSTGGSAQLVIVNGPITREIGMNSGGNVFGPGNRANATIGRAVRLIVINSIGSIPGVVDMSTLGHGGKYSYCIAEAEEESPWEPLHVEKGFPKSASTVTVISSQGGHQVHDYPGNGGAVAAIADGMASCGPGFGGMTVVMGPEPASLLAREGLSKRQVKEALFKGSQRSVASMKEHGRVRGAVASGDERSVEATVPDADSITLVVAGGQAGRFSAVIPPWGRGLASEPQVRLVGGSS